MSEKPVRVRINTDGLNYPKFEGQHCWVVSVMFRCANPQSIIDGNDFHMDHETAIWVAGPMCCHCGAAWHQRLVKCRNVLP